MKIAVSCACSLLLATLMIFSFSVLQPVNVQAESCSHTCNNGEHGSLECGCLACSCECNPHLSCACYESPFPNPDCGGGNN